MNTDYITLGSVPLDEACAQVGDSNYDKRSRMESRAFINQLYRIFGKSPLGTHITPKSFPHDFGSYVEVCVVYDTDSEASEDFAFKVECAIPTEWDSEARIELKETMGENYIP